MKGLRFSFSAPASWRVTHSPRGISVAPAGDDVTLVSVTVFRLARPFRPALWPSVVEELDRVARSLAARLDGKVETRRTIEVAGRRAREYELSFTRRGEELGERITFLLQSRREYQLLCRWRSPRSDAISDACDRLSDSFRPA